jgi:hypothetical protein
LGVLTLFSAPKPFGGAVDILQRNAIRSWQVLGKDVQVLLIGDENGIEAVARELGVTHVPNVARNENGTPRVDSIFDLARRHASGPTLAYVNADIVLFGDLLAAVRILTDEAKAYLMVGQRWDLAVKQAIEFGTGWEDSLRQRLFEEGRLHPPGGSDFFVFPDHCYQEIPPFAVGRAGWDNWMIYEARRRRWPVVDATGAVTAVHQDHDYQHLPGGRPHYQLPESHANLRMAGGRRRVFRLQDADFQLSGGHLRRRPFTPRRILNEMERAPVLHSQSNAVFALFHPLKAWGELRGALFYALRRQRARNAIGREGG